MTTPPRRILEHKGTASYRFLNPNPQLLPEGENAQPLHHIGSTASEKLLIVMVGLPATGKSHISKWIGRFLTFFHDIPTRIFNVGEYRRTFCGVQLPASFYDHGNAEYMKQRRAACDAALEDLLGFMGMDGLRVGVFDATNSTRERRGYLRTRLKESGIGAKIMFVESICDDDKILEENIRAVKLATPDYQGMDPEDAVQDFLERRQKYLDIYEPVDDSDLHYIKIFNCRKFVVYNIHGYLPLKVCHFVMNLHTMPRTFYLTRHGQSEYNTLGKIGGDSGLSKAGIEYAHRLAKYAEETISKQTTISPTGEETHSERPCRLWTSTLRRSKETAQFFKHNVIHHTFDNGQTCEWTQFRPTTQRNLDELYAGLCDGMTYANVESSLPEEYKRRQTDKLTYRYPRGESYLDVIHRLEPLALEIERTREPVLIIGHQCVTRILYAYFMGLKRSEAPFVDIPFHTVIQLTPHAYGCYENKTCLMDVEEYLVDGHVPITTMPRKEKSIVEVEDENEGVDSMEVSNGV